MFEKEYRLLNDNFSCTDGIVAGFLICISLMGWLMEFGILR